MVAQVLARERTKLSSRFTGEQRLALRGQPAGGLSERRFARVDTYVPAALLANGVEHPCFVINLSAGGALVPFSSCHQAAPMCSTSEEIPSSWLDCSWFLFIYINNKQK